MSSDAGTTTSRRYQGRFRLQTTTVINAAAITANCPNSTPTLNPNNAGINCVAGSPNSPSTLAKPSPCNRPKKKINNSRQRCNVATNIFSTATNIIEAAINGSTTEAGMLTHPIAPKNKANVWASVKILTCHTSDLSPAAKKSKPSTNKMWSRPLGMMCENPTGM